MTKQHILDEIKRTANANAGIPLGFRRFFDETGIKVSDWSGKYWVRWSEAVIEAGYTPNQKTQAFDDELLIVKLISLSRELGHFPVNNELRMKSRNDSEFPDSTTFRRLGSKSQLVSKVVEYCRAHEGFEDVLAMCGTNIESDSANFSDEKDDIGEVGFVYLLKSGGFYKIGKSNAFGRRERELQIQLPEKANMVHQIKTDDPAGIENYWHRRFESRRKNGEWFDLSASEVKAFKRRKFM